MIAMLARPLAVAAAIGWVACIVVSLLSIAGFVMPQGVPIALFMGVFPLWLCAVLMMHRLMKRVSPDEMWKALLRGCPSWLRYAIWASWGYAFLSFALVWVSGMMGEITGFDGRLAGFVSVFYSVALGTFVTTITRENELTECSNGHPIGPFDKFCRECGAEIKRNTVKLVS